MLGKINQRKSFKLLAVITFALVVSQTKSDIPHCIRYQNETKREICAECEERYFVETKAFFLKTGKCLKCSPACLTCTDVNTCLTCPKFKTLKNVTEFFVPGQTCVLELPYMIGGFCVIFGWAILVYYMMSICFCTKVKDISKQFLVRGNLNEHYVNVGELMQNPQQYNAGNGPQNQHGYYNPLNRQNGQTQYTAHQQQPMQQQQQPMQQQQNQELAKDKVD